MQTTVTIRGQTVIPAKIRREFNILPHTQLEWIDDGKVITVLPIYGDAIKAVRGMYKDANLRKELLKFRKEERRRG